MPRPAGWTPEDYVLPRLASGMLYGQECGRSEVLAFLGDEGHETNLWDEQALRFICGSPVYLRKSGLSAEG